MGTWKMMFGRKYDEGEVADAMSRSLDVGRTSVLFEFYSAQYRKIVDAGDADETQADRLKVVAEIFLNALSEFRGKVPRPLQTNALSRLDGKVLDLEGAARRYLG